MDENITTYHLVVDVSNYTYEDGYKLFERIQNDYNLYDNCVIDIGDEGKAEQIVIESSDKKKLITLGYAIKKNYKLGKMLKLKEVDISDTIIDEDRKEETGGLAISIERCLFCDKEIDISKSKLKKFCSPRCRTNFNSFRDYHKNKDKPEFKEDARKRFKIWLNKNRAHFNNLLREKNRIRNGRNRDSWRAAGLCARCGKTREDEGKKSCRACRIKTKMWKENAK